MSNDDEKGLQVAEFYSGIGGLHCGFDQCGVKGEVLHAFDINTAANDVYKHNFPSTKLHQRNLVSFSTADHEKMAANVWLMSPPCQPYTRQGKQEGSKDLRAQSFLHLVDLLGRLQAPPSYILIENVFGFEKSDTHEVLVQQLSSLDYTYQEFLLTPDQFKIPNSRLRYFLLAKKHPRSFRVACPTGLVQTEIPGDDQCSPSPAHHSYHYTNEGKNGNATEDAASPKNEECDVSANDSISGNGTYACDDNAKSKPLKRSAPIRDPDSWKRQKKGSNLCRHLSEFLEVDNGSGDDENNRLKGNFVPENVVVKKGAVFDIVTADDTRSCCFTKAYSKYHEGTGSVLQTNTTMSYTSAFEPIMASTRARQAMTRHNKDIRTSDNGQDHTPAPVAAEGIASITELKSYENSEVTQAQVDNVMGLGLRFFSPREIARLHCFPESFVFPSTTTTNSAYRLLGNSLNVRVVARLLTYLFDETGTSSM
eukprot:CFRG3860T1